MKYLFFYGNCWDGFHEGVVGVTFWLCYCLPMKSIIFRGDISNYIKPGTFSAQRNKKEAHKNGHKKLAICFLMLVFLLSSETSSTGKMLLRRAAVFSM